MKHRVILLLLGLACASTSNAQLLRGLREKVANAIEGAGAEQDEKPAAQDAPPTADAPRRGAPGAQALPFAASNATATDAAAANAAAAEQVVRALEQAAPADPVAAQQVAAALQALSPAVAALPYCNDASRVASAGDANPIERALMKRLVDQVLAQVGLEGAQLQEPITSRCGAERRFAYVTQYTGLWSANVIGAVENAASALQIDHQNEAYLAFQADVPFEDHSGGSIAQLEKNLSGELGRIEEALKTGEVANAEMLDRAVVDMRVAMAQGLHIVSWDRKLAEFMGDDTQWTKQNLGRLRLFVEHARLLGGTIGSIGRVLEAREASGTTGDEERMQALFAEAAERDAASRAELAALYQL